MSSTGKVMNPGGLVRTRATELSLVTQIPKFMLTGQREHVSLRASHCLPYPGAGGHRQSRLRQSIQTGWVALGSFWTVR